MALDNKIKRQTLLGSIKSRKPSSESEYYTNVKGIKQLRKPVVHTRAKALREFLEKQKKTLKPSKY